MRSLVDKTLADLGVITHIFTPSEFEALITRLGPSEDADENKVGKVLRLALPEERQLLPVKFQKEQPILNVCQAFVQRNDLPMTVYGVEYQFDGKILFVYYVSKDRVDFRPLVKFLAKTYCKSIRVQMRKTTQCRDFYPCQFATEALLTGQYCNSGHSTMAQSNNKSYMGI